MAFSELIKSFGTAREYISDFFIYGCRVRNDYTGKSPRSYDDGKRRAENWLKDYMRCENTPRGKQVSISVDSSRIAENPLYSVFYSKSFTDNDIRLHFLLTDILSGGRELTLGDIADGLSKDYGAVFDVQTVRGKLKEYAAEGIINVRRQGRTDYFSLSDDTAEKLFAEYEGLAEAVKFFSEAGELGVAGNSLLKAAGLVNDLFFIKHNYIVHTLEDEILAELVEAIEYIRCVSIENCGKHGGITDCAGVPLKIYVSVQTGRRYLIMYLTGRGRLTSFRLDHIKSVRHMEQCADYEKYADILARNEDRLFGVSFGERNGGNGTERVKLTIRADEQRERFIIDRLYREKRGGKVEKAGSGLFVWSAEVFDANEMLPWVKSFTGRIVRFECSNEQVTAKLCRDLERMYRIYGTDS